MDPSWIQSRWEAFPPPAAFFVPSNNQLAHFQPQSQSHIRLPLAGQQKEAGKYTAKDWDTHRAEITRLYEHHTLPAIIDSMRKNYGLDATPKQYEDRFAKWGIEKSIRPTEMRAMLRKKQERASNIQHPKNSAFRLRGKEVTLKVDRYIKEHSTQSFDANIDWDMHTNMVSAPTPGAISCYTPATTGPLTPYAASSPQASSVISSTMNPQSPISYGSLYSGSYHCGGPAPLLPSSLSVVQITASFHGQPSSPTSIASRPNLPTLIESNKTEFKDQSLALFSVQSSSQPQNHDLMQDIGMGVVYDEDPQTSYSSYERIAPSSHAVSSTSLDVFLETDPLQSLRSGEEDLFDIGGIAAVTAMPLSEEYAAMILSVDDAWIIDQYVPAQLVALERSHELAAMLCRQGRYETALQMHRHTLQLRQEKLGLKHRDTLKSMHGVAVALRYHGRYDNAEKMHRQTLQLRTKELGSMHPDTLKSMHELGMALYYHGSYKNAENLHRQTLRLRQEVLPAEHRDTLRSVQGLAASFASQGRYKPAERMMRQALDGYERSLGNEHPHTIENVSGLANVLYCQGKYKVAEAMVREALDKFEKVLGKEHPKTLISVFSLGHILNSQGNYKLAEEMARRSLDGRKKILGKEHPATLTSLWFLAEVLESQGKYDEAEEIMRQELDTSEKILGKEHPNTLTSFHSLAWVLRSQGDYTGAENTMRRALNGREKVLGKEHPFTLTSVYCLARIMCSKRQHYLASLYFQRASAGFEKILGSNHPTTRDCIRDYLAMSEGIRSNLSERKGERMEY